VAYEKLTHFDRMWNAYPNPGEGADAAKATVGGAAMAPWITNTCVLRVSRSMNEAGHAIPGNTPGLFTIVGGDGMRYALRVIEMSQYLTTTYGPPSLRVVIPVEGAPTPPSFLGRQGIICFDVKGWTDATGHFDLWNGERCVHNHYFHRAQVAYLWEVSSADPALSLSAPPPRARPMLSGSVGASGLNRRDDVRVVQQLLANRGIDPGTIDGLVGTKTIEAIRTMQAAFLTRPDGRIDVDGRSWNELNKLG